MAFEVFVQGSNWPSPTAAAATTVRFRQVGTSPSIIFSLERSNLHNDKRATTSTFTKEALDGGGSGNIRLGEETSTRR